MTFGNPLDAAAARELLAVARDQGVNFFDSAEGYAKGRAEQILGDNLKALGWERGSYVVSSKFFRGLGDGPNQARTLNRKYLLNAIDGSLRRLGLDYVDLAYAHRPDPETPIEETVWAFHDIINRGKALYWGTSEWSADEIRAAWQIAERHHLHKPVVEQPQYNLFTRTRVEQEYARLYQDQGLGLTIWGPLAAGLLSGKYLEGIPEDSRAGRAVQGGRLKERIADAGKRAAIERLSELAAELQVSLAQLSLAWALLNPNVSTVITGATKVDQLQSNLKALELLPKLTPEVIALIDAAIAGTHDLKPPAPVFP
jgi:voltage-dependent potassium channel beta subunit